MKIFEEDFPSWKGFDWGKFSPYQVELIKNMLTTCDKDKQKIRDAIDKLMNNAEIINTPSHILTDEQHGYAYAFGDLSRELNL
jgi:hypothetical protein